MKEASQNTVFNPESACSSSGRHLESVTEPVRQRDRRREKPQLSCTFCRRRKIKCDRQLPCKTCVGKGISLACTYAPNPQRDGTSSVGERIQQLESMVRSLLRKQQLQQEQIAQPLQQPTPQTPVVATDSSIPSSPQSSQVHSPDSVSTGLGSTLHLRSSTTGDLRPATPPTKLEPPSPAPSDHGSMRMHSHGANYVNSVHWAAVLDSISDLKDHYEKEEEERMLATNYDPLPRQSPGPRLLYEPVEATKDDILSSIPARPAVDRMVARYFNMRGAGLAVLHSSQFLRQYEVFWQDPAATPYAWISLLFSVMCLSLQYQTTLQGMPDEHATQIYDHRERTVQCLVLAQFTKGGPHVVETMLHYCASELMLLKDADIGIWFVQGILVQLALSLGFHRDPQNFPNLSPFESEMRRRVWSYVVQIDLRLASQMGLPRLLKSQQCDTAEPRNLLDEDFDEDTIEMPPSRPETEVTPILYGLAKNRVDAIGGQISDLTADLREIRYSEVMELDQKIQDSGALLPAIFRWQPLSRSFMVPAQVLLHRIWLKLALQRLHIWLHRKYLNPSYTHADYKYSRHACVKAAITILELQQLVSEETQPDGQLYPIPWMVSSLAQSAFLLGMSVLCYCVQLAKTTPEVMPDQETSIKAEKLLRETYPLWVRSSVVSRDAGEAVDHLSAFLGMRDRQQGKSATPNNNGQFYMPQGATMAFDQVTWDVYQECVANFPATFSDDFLVPDLPGLASNTNFSLADPMLTDAAEVDGWMERRD